MKSIALKCFAFILLALSVVAISFYFLKNTKTPDLTPSNVIDGVDLFTTDIQPIFDSRCVACHSCFNAPCQLKLSSFAGTERGANQTSIYDFPTFTPRAPTRLFIDAHDVSGWREKEFYSVTSQTKEDISILEMMLTRVPGVESGLQEKFDSEWSRTCVAEASERELERYKKANPAGRMPFGLPPLEPRELKTVQNWLLKGAPGPVLKDREDAILNQKLLAPLISDWEALLNGKTLQSKLSSRYIYEHLFLAHLYFDQHPQIFFRLVRSKSKSGPVEEIATRYPFDDPRSEFFYRLRPVTSTLTHKSHIPYALNQKKRNLWTKQFFKADWGKTLEAFPPYGRAGSNPFKTFKEIPTQVRYEFFLQDAGYHVMTFIKGPVCRGQTALNVINDHFWVMFVEPSKDPLVTSKKIYDHVASVMEMPAEIKGDFDPFIGFRKNYWKALDFKYDSLKRDKISLDESWIWNGDKENTNALLTIFRHFDSATVLRGLHGETPKTVWVIDYHVFESIYYNLTAGYDVFGPLLHQLNSRLYMEISRIASEDLFLSFLNPEVRQEVRSSWNLPVPEENKSIAKRVAEIVTSDVQEKMKFEYPYPGSELPSKIEKTSASSKEKLIDHLLTSRFSKHQVNNSSWPSNKTLEKLEQIKPLGVRYFPDTILLHVEGEDVPFTLIHNKDHFNVGMLFFEQERRNLKNDSLSVYRGIATSYANLFMKVKAEKLSQFIDQVNSVKSEEDLSQVFNIYGVSRKSDQFWKEYEWFSARTIDRETNESGWLDLNRYVNF